MRIVDDANCNLPRKLRNVCLQLGDGAVDIRVPLRYSVGNEGNRI